MFFEEETPILLQAGIPEEDVEILKKWTPAGTVGNIHLALARSGNS